MTQPTVSKHFFTTRTFENATNSRTLFPLRHFTKALAVIHGNPLEIHTVTIPILYCTTHISHMTMISG